MVVVVVVVVVLVVVIDFVVDDVVDDAKALSSILGDAVVPVSTGR